MPVQLLNHPVEDPHLAYFTIICGAQSGFMIRVQVPQNTRDSHALVPRVNGLLSISRIAGPLSPVDPAFRQNRNVNREERAVLCRYQPPGAECTGMVRENRP